MKKITLCYAKVIDKIIQKYETGKSEIENEKEISKFVFVVILFILALNIIDL